MKLNFFIIAVICVIFYCVTLSGCLSSENGSSNVTVHNQTPGNGQNIPFTEDVEYLNYQGFDSLNKGDYTNALLYFNKALTTNSSNPVILNNIAYIYYISGKYNESIGYYQEAIALSPKDVTYYYNLAAVYEKLGEYSKQKDNLGKALVIDPQSNLYINYENDPSLNKANVRLGRLEVTDPRDFQQLVQLGIKSVKNIKYENAEYFFNLASISAERNPTSTSQDSNFLNNYGVILAFLNKDHQALIKLNDALSRDGSNAIILKNKAIISNEMDKKSNEMLYFRFDEPLYQVDTNIVHGSGITIGRKFQAVTGEVSPITPVQEYTIPTTRPGHDFVASSLDNGSLRVFSDRGFFFKYPAEYSVIASEQEKDRALDVRQRSWDYSYYDPLADIFLAAFENQNQTKRLDIYYGGQAITFDGYYNHMRNEIATDKNFYEMYGYYCKIPCLTYATVTRTNIPEGINAVVIESNIFNSSAPIVPYHPPKEGGKVMTYVIFSGNYDYVLRFSYDDYHVADSDAPIRTEVINSIKLLK